MHQGTFIKDNGYIHCKPLQLDYIFATTQKLQGTAGCRAWEFAAQLTANKCNFNIFFNCRELPVVKSTAGQQVYYIQKMYPTFNCQKYSQSTAEKGTRLKAVCFTTERFAVYYLYNWQYTLCSRKPKTERSVPKKLVWIFIQGGAR